MKLEKIIKIADEIYPDGLVQQAYEANKDRGIEDELVSVGDGLAEFIARELADTYDAKASRLEQLEEADRVMTRASGELTAVALRFNRLHRDAQVKDPSWNKPYKFPKKGS